MANKKSSDPIGRQRTKPVLHLLLFGGMCFAWAMSAYAAEMAQGFEKNNRLHSIELNGYYDPARNYLVATARLQFAVPADERYLWLASGLQLSSVSSASLPILDFKRDCGSLVVQNSGERELELRYSGRIAAGQYSGETNAQYSKRNQNQFDEYHILSHVKDFYPHPLLDFTPMKTNISIPDGWNCLGSGTLLEIQPEADGNKYMFDSVDAKGMALVCGRFQQIALVSGVIPIRLHGAPGFRFADYFNATEMARILTFYSKQFGPLSVPELNVLFRRSGNFCGVSYKGLIVLDVDTSWPALSAQAKIKIEWGSMISMNEAQGDLLAHEMAHQWWGGQISWKTAADNWITEGLATYSTLAYLRDRLGEKAYRKILCRMRQKMKRFSRQGFPAAGFKLKAMQNDLKVYQALVYIKPALMLAALADKIGQDELFLRLRGILTDNLCRNVNSAEFLAMLSGGDQSILAGLEKWIFAEGLPGGL